METYLTELEEETNVDEFVVIDNSVLTTQQLSTYFGDNARVLFNQQCQKTSRKNKIATLDRSESNSSTPKRAMSGTYKRSDSTFSGCSTLSLELDQYSKSSPLKSITKLSCLPERPATQESSESPFKRKGRSALDLSRKTSYTFDQMMSRNIARRSTIDGSCKSSDAFTDPELIDQQFIQSRKSELSISVEFHDEDARGSVTKKKQTLDTTQNSSQLLQSPAVRNDHNSDMGSALSSLSKGNMARKYFEFDEIENDNDWSVPFEDQPLTPRTRFISSCIKEGLNPRASMVLYSPEVTDSRILL